MAVGSNPEQSQLANRSAAEICLLGLCIAVYWAWKVQELTRPMYFMVGVVVAAYLAPYLSRAASILLLDSKPTSAGDSKAGSKWPWVGLAGVTVVVAFLEFRQPYYFTQDDNLAQFLPGILQGCRSLAKGVFPTWNPYQFLGSPTTTVGTYALTYPPTWASYWFAKSVLHREYATVDVFSVLHLLVAYGVIYWTARRECIRPMLATLAALCCVLSGYALIVGRSWYYMSPVFVWVPLLMICLQAARQGPLGWKGILSCGLVIGAFAHSGNVQMWAYALLFFLFAVVLMLGAGVVPWRSVISLGAGVLLGLALAAPLLVPQFLATQNVERIMIDAGIGGGVPTLLVPVTVVQTWHPLGWGSIDKQYVGQMYYSGTIFCLIGVFLLLGLFLIRWNRKATADNVWFLCALLAFILALGDAGPLWRLLLHAPGFNKFRSPFKFLQFFDIFIAVAGACAWERILHYRRSGLRFEALLAVGVGCLLTYHCWLALPSFYTYGIRPYPQLPSAVLARLQPGDKREYPKILAIGPPRSTEPDYFNSLQHQWPSVYGVFSAGGYDPLVSKDRLYMSIAHELYFDPAVALREYGVQYVVVYDERYAAGRLCALNPRMYWLGWLRRAAAPVYESAKTTLWKLPDPRPMAWADASPMEPLPVAFDGAGADLNTASLPAGGWITLNMIRRPEISARTGNKRLPVTGDAWNRIRVQVPPGTAQVRVNFAPPWGIGFAVAGLLGLLAAVLGWVYQRYEGSAQGQNRARIYSGYEVIGDHAPTSGKSLSPVGRP